MFWCFSGSGIPVGHRNCFLFIHFVLAMLLIVTYNTIVSVLDTGSSYMTQSHSPGPLVSYGFTVVYYGAQDRVPSFPSAKFSALVEICTNWGHKSSGGHSQH